MPRVFFTVYTYVYVFYKIIKHTIRTTATGARPQI